MGVVNLATLSERERDIAHSWTRRFLMNRKYRVTNDKFTFALLTLFTKIL